MPSVKSVKFLLKAGSIAMRAHTIYMFANLVRELVPKKQREKIADAWDKTKDKSGEAAKKLLVKYAPDVIDELAEKKAKELLPQDMNELMVQTLNQVLDARGVKGDFDAAAEKTPAKKPARKPVAKKSTTQKRKPAAQKRSR